MKIIASRTSLGEIREDVLIVPVFEGETPGDSENASALAALDHLTGGAVASVFHDGEVTGKRDRWVLLHNVGQFSTKRLLFYGAGNPEKIDSISLGRLAGAAVRTLIKNRGIRSAAFLVTRKLESEAFVQAIVEGAVIGQMSGELYRSKEEPAGEIETLDLVSELPDPPDFERAMRADQPRQDAGLRTLERDDSKRARFSSEEDGRARRARVRSARRRGNEASRHGRTAGGLTWKPGTCAAHRDELRTWRNR